MRNTGDKLRDTVLPSPSVLESYESMASGSVKKLITMSEKEQLNRHSLQRKYFFSYILGQLFSFTLGAGALYLIYCLAKSGDVVSVMTVASVYFLIFISALIYTSKKKGSSYTRRNTRTRNTRNIRRQGSGRRERSPRQDSGRASRNSRSRVVMR